MRAATLALAAALIGCSPGSSSPRADAGHRDAAPVDDAFVGADAASSDAGADAPSVDAALGSRCEVSASAVSCAHETTTLATTTTTPDRAVHHQVPLGAPPAAGFPVVIAFQGAALPSEMSWSGRPTDLYGLYDQALTIARLLDAGFAVITPDAALGGTTYYDTNIPPYATSWESAPDHQLMLHLFAAIEAGDLGELDASSMFAMGFSSGGYMTSRMAVSYPGRFRALAIASGSYATCGGSLCFVPSTLPADHPPTLFLHGELDPIVPIGTMRPYESTLRAQGIATRVVTDPAAVHQWIGAAPDAVLAWFIARR